MLAGAAAAVVAGLAVGIGFIALFALIASSAMPLYAKTSSNNTSQDRFEAAEIMTRELSEVKAFLNTYPNANSTVYFTQVCSDDSCSSLSRIPSVAEYSYKESGSRKYADLRIGLQHEHMQPTFMQIRCAIIHKETNTILNSETDLLEQHGERLTDVAEFLQNDLCPSHAT